MSIAPAAVVHVWEQAGIPARLVWAQRRYRVLTAEPIPRPAGHAASAHPAEQLVGWVLTAAAEDDPAHVRVLQLQAAGTGWVLVDVDPA